MAINVIDILLFLVFIAIVCIGYIGGTIRLMLILAAIYLGTLVSALFYLPLAAFLAGGLPELELFTAQIVTFFLLAALGTAAFAVSLIKTLHSLRLPHFLAGLDQIGGAAFGALVATVSIVVITAILHAAFGAVLLAEHMGVAIWPFMLSLAHQLHTSFLAALFVELSTPILFVIRPWFPNGLPAILNLK